MNTLKDYEGFIFDLRPLELEELDGSLDLSKLASGTLDMKVMIEFMKTRLITKPEGAIGTPAHIVLANMEEMTNGIFGRLMDMVKDGANEAKKKLQNSA